MRVYQNPDTEYANEIKKRLKSNNGYCPCSPIKNSDSKCRCKEFRDQVKRGEPGMCSCGLWVAEE